MIDRDPNLWRRQAASHYLIQIYINQSEHSTLFLEVVAVTAADNNSSSEIC